MNAIYFVEDISFDYILPLIDKIQNSKGEKFVLYLSTNGGSATASLFFRNWLRHTNKIKKIICIGDINSGGALLLCGLKPIKRLAYPYITFGIHSLRFTNDEYPIPFNEQLTYNKTSSFLEDTIIDIYYKYLNIDDNILEKIKAGYTYYINPIDAKRIGLIDDIVPLEEVI